jgi:hypothetical protein
LEYWSVGVLEYWSIGVLEYWSIGVLSARYFFTAPHGQDFRSYRWHSIRW